MNRWITIVGIGEDGMEGLGTRAREVIAGAEILIGGERHLALVPEGAAARATWGKDFDHGVAAIRAHDRRAELKELDVKHMRPTWDELQREIDWVSCGWASDWERRAKYSKVPYREVSYLLTDSAATSRMLFASAALGHRWANMPSVIRERRRIG